MTLFGEIFYAHVAILQTSQKSSCIGTASHNFADWLVRDLQGEERLREENGLTEVEMQNLQYFHWSEEKMTVHSQND